MNKPQTGNTTAEHVKVVRELADEARAEIAARDATPSEQAELPLSDDPLCVCGHRKSIHIATLLGVDGCCDSTYCVCTAFIRELAEREAATSPVLDGTRDDAGRVVDNSGDGPAGLGLPDRPGVWFRLGQWWVVHDRKAYDIRGISSHNTPFFGPGYDVISLPCGDWFPAVNASELTALRSQVATLDKSAASYASTAVRLMHVVCDQTENITMLEQQVATLERERDEAKAEAESLKIKIGVRDDH